MIFGVIMRKVVRRGNFVSQKALRDRLLWFIEYFNKTMAKPFHWTFTGNILQSGRRQRLHKSNQNDRYHSNTDKSICSAQSAVLCKVALGYALKKSQEGQKTTSHKLLNIKGLCDVVRSDSVSNSKRLRPDSNRGWRICNPLP